ncbi:MAG: tetratricopeptide repeat protein [Acidobacteria bacterium]|nr:MAG: tetratricopeptide repeat protein [Acidobacteriota bacterium]
MRRIVAITSLLGLLCGSASGQGQPTPQPPNQGQPAPAPPSTPPAQPAQGQPDNQPAPPPVKPPRVVGQPQSEQEREAWMAIERAASLEEKGQLAEKYLTQFPESGLTPFAHQILAFRYQQANDYDNFVLHAEKSLEEVPDNPVLLALLGAAYAQRDQADKATARAQQALQLLERMVKPANMSEADWVMNKEQLEADSRYALGVASLARQAQNPAATVTEDQNLKAAIAELEKAIELDPAHDRGYFQLGFAFAKQNNAEKSIQAYARAAAIGGPVQALAREQLGKVYEFVFKNTEGVEQVIEREKEYINQKVAQRQARLQAIQTAAPPAQPTSPASPQPAPPQPAPPAPQP